MRYALHAAFSLMLFSLPYFADFSFSRAFDFRHIFAIMPLVFAAFSRCCFHFRFFCFLSLATLFFFSLLMLLILRLATPLADASLSLLLSPLISPLLPCCCCRYTIC